MDLKGGFLRTGIIEISGVMHLERVDLSLWRGGCGKVLYSSFWKGWFSKVSCVSLIHSEQYLKLSSFPVSL